MVKVSIIVPVYNSEEYINTCFDSISTQTYKDFECILVDDGSTDNSPMLCDEYCKKDLRFRVIHKKNGGPSSARNSGLEIASGEYITFSDSDDFLHPQWLEVLVGLLESNDNNSAAFVNLKRVKFLDEVCIEQCKTNELLEKSVIYSKEEIFSDYSNITNENELFYGFMSIKIFKRELFENIRFPEDIGCYEDVYIMVDLFCKMKQVITLDFPLYFYRQNQGSILHNNNNAASALNWLRYFLHTAEILDKDGNQKQANIFFQYFVYFYFEFLHKEYDKFQSRVDKKYFVKVARILFFKYWKRIRKNPLTTRAFVVCMYINLISISLTRKCIVYLFDD